MKIALTVCLGLVGLLCFVFAPSFAFAQSNLPNSNLNSPPLEIQTKVQTPVKLINQIENNTSSQPLLLKPKKKTLFSGGKSSGKSSTGKSIPGSPESMAFTFGILAALILGIFVCAKLIKRKNPILGRSLPGEVFETLGRKPINARQAIHFFRCGSRILVVASSDEGLSTLSEINDPVEVDYISGLCRAGETSGNSTEMFRNLFQKTFSKNKPVTSPQQRPAHTPEMMQPATQDNQSKHLSRVSEQLDRAVRQQ